MCAIFIAPVIGLSAIPSREPHWTAVVPPPLSLSTDVVGSNPRVLSSHLMSEPIVFSQIVDPNEATLSSPQTPTEASCFMPIVTHGTYEVAIAQGVHVASSTYKIASIQHHAL